MAEFKHYTTMKKLLTICCALICCNAFAQDIITKKDGTDIRAKVLEITTNEVKYKLYDEPDGITYTSRKSELIMICYESGRKDVFANNSHSELYIADSASIESITPNMKYKQLKSLYNYKDYYSSSADRYNPAVSGVASFFIPGLGQIICGEAGRGLGYLGGHLGGMLLARAITGAGTDEYGYISTGAALTSLIIYTGVIALDICAIVDGVRVAKVKNMYEHDLRNIDLSVDLYPSVNLVQMNNSTQPVVGLTLSMTF